MTALDLTDLELQSLDINSNEENLEQFSSGHGLTEIGASCHLPLTCNGSCSVPTETALRPTLNTSNEKERV